MKKKSIKHEPYKRFKGFLCEKGLTYLDIARELGISEASVNKKINGVSDFYISQIELLENVLGVDHHIFLNDKLS